MSAGGSAVRPNLRVGQECDLIELDRAGKTAPGPKEPKVGYNEDYWAEAELDRQHEAAELRWEIERDERESREDD